MGEGNRVVLPAPMVGHYETHDVKMVTLAAGTTITAENAETLKRVLDTVLAYPVGDYDVQLADQVMRVSVGERRIVTLNVQIEADADPILFERLVDRLQASYDEIRVPAATYGQTLRDHLVNRGFASDARPLLPTYGQVAQGASVPLDNMVWFRTP